MTISKWNQSCIDIQTLKDEYAKLPQPKKGEIDPHIDTRRSLGERAVSLCYHRYSLIKEMNNVRDQQIPEISASMRRIMESIYNNPTFTLEGAYKAFGIKKT